MTKKKYVNTNTSTIVDLDTGQVLKTETNKSFTIQTKTEKFYMTFIDHVSPIFKLGHGNDKNLLVALCTRAEYNTGVVRLTATDRKNLSEELNLSKQQITNSMAHLKTLSLLAGEKGVFTLNPQIFWVGDIDTREKLLNSEGIKITFNIVSSDASNTRT